MQSSVSVDGPYFEDLAIGDRFDTAPAVELTSGFAATHHAIVGGRLRLAFDPELAQRVTGRAPFANPALVWDVAIGQSTEVTRRAVANLFYRGLSFGNAPAVGDTLRTVTTITGLRTAAAKPGRSPRGLVVMRIETRDQKDRPILNFHRCAMLPGRRELPVRYEGELEPPRSTERTENQLPCGFSHWDLEAFRASIPGPHFESLVEGQTYNVVAGDLVSSAPELARLTMNLASIHHDNTEVPSRQRLVYGGHTIGLAAAQITRALPALVTFLAWEDCDHLGPVREGDTLHSEVTIIGRQPLSGGGGLVRLRCHVRATAEDGAASDVLEWRLTGLFA